jgi:hypothetical protein
LNENLHGRETRVPDEIVERSQELCEKLLRPAMSSYDQTVYVYKHGFLKYKNHVRCASRSDIRPGETQSDYIISAID